MDVARLVHLAAEIEFAIFAAAFLICIVILSLKTGCFLVGAALDHSFPGWRAGLRRIPELLPATIVGRRACPPLEKTNEA